ncbi:MAG: hypothetical protein AB7O50_10955 [Pseudolabrys sp.]
MLEACAEGAGRALACPYSSSAEFDAALIHARRAAGVYGPRRHRRMLNAAAGVLAGMMAVVLVLL